MSENGEFHLHGEPAEVDAIVHVGEKQYVLARNEHDSAAVRLHGSDTGAESIAASNDAPVYEIDVDD